MKYLDNYNLFCLYQYTDPAYRHFFTVLKNQFTVKDNQVLPTIDCKISDNINFLVPKGYFITFKGNMRPLGNNMALIFLKKNPSFPYEIQDVIVEYDLFAEYDESYIRMVVYTTPVENSYPIYIYRLNSNNSIVFDITGSEFNPQTMTRFSLPTIYVLKKPYKYFKNIDGICIPTDEKGDGIESCNMFKPKTRLIKKVSKTQTRNYWKIIIIILISLILIKWMFSSTY